MPLSRFSPLHDLKVSSVSGVGLSIGHARELINGKGGRKPSSRLILCWSPKPPTMGPLPKAGYQRAGILRKMGELNQALKAYSALIGEM